MIIEQLAETLKRGRRYLLTSHRKPDGDSIGSSMAMALILEQMGKEAVVRNRDPYPTAYGRLPLIDRVQTGEIERGEPFDAVITMECTEKERPGLDHIADYPIINIDHHMNNSMFGIVNWVDTDACAVGEMIFDYAKRTGAKITPEIATYLYVSINTDTGSFHFSNTSVRAFEICAELTRAGANPHFVADALYDHNRPGQVMLLGRCLSRLRIDWELKAAEISMFQKDLEEINISDGDTEGIINYPRSIDGIEIAVFFKEAGPAHFRVGLRSRGAIDVAALAAEFGGGGHTKASGCSIHGSFEEVRRTLYDALRRRAAAVAGSSMVAGS